MNNKFLKNAHVMSYSIHDRKYHDFILANLIRRYTIVKSTQNGYTLTELEMIRIVSTSLTRAFHRYLKRVPNTLTPNPPSQGSREKLRRVLGGFHKRIT